MAKKTVKERRIHNQEKQNRRKERLDKSGLKHEKVKNPFSYSLFCILKIITIVSVPLFYFLYSPLLIASMLAFIFLFFLSFRVEKTINRSVLKTNYVHIVKLDSAIALLAIVISIFSVCMGFTTKTKQSNFKRQTESTFVTNITNLSTLLTGSRTLFGNNHQFKFGTKDAPEGFISNKDDLHDKMDGMTPPDDFFEGKDPGSLPMDDFDFKDFGDGFGKRFDTGTYQVSLGDLPFEYIFSSLLSTINTVLVFSCSVFGTIGIIITEHKRKKREKDDFEIVEETKFIPLDKNEILSILCSKEEIDDSPTKVDYFIPKIKEN